MCNKNKGPRRQAALSLMCACLVSLSVFAANTISPEQSVQRFVIAAGFDAPVGFDIAADGTAIVATGDTLWLADGRGAEPAAFASRKEADLVGVAMHAQYPMLPYVYALAQRDNGFAVLRFAADPATSYRRASVGKPLELATGKRQPVAIASDPHGVIRVSVATSSGGTERIQSLYFDGVTGRPVASDDAQMAQHALPGAAYAARDGKLYWLDVDAGLLWRQRPAMPRVATGDSGTTSSHNDAAHVATLDGSPSEHALGDAYWARLARDAKPFDTAGALARATRSPVQVGGQWGPVIGWPHVAVSAANLPDGRILTFASNQTTSFPVGPEFTYAATWDPKTGVFVNNNHGSHDMFCGHLVMLDDGRVFINGGRNTVRLTSSYDFQTDAWSVEAQQVNGRWYPTTVALPDGRVFTAIGSGGGQYPDVWAPGAGWGLKTGIDFNGPILNYPDSQFGERNWWPYLQVKPDGHILHAGPTPKMHDIDLTGAGSITQVGPEIWDWYPKHAGVVMYDVGKILIAGGWTSGTNVASSARSMTVDFNGATPVVTEIAPMNFARKFQNAVMLPTGDVLIVGGNTSGLKFNDSGAVLEAELWQPATSSWTVLNPMSVPRTYHSVALLMTDGRVLSAGSGLAGNAAVDHDDGQVYTPPYLFAPDGTPAIRPVISAGPAIIDPGSVFAVSASTGIARFTMIRMAATTHAMSTDLRFLEVGFSNLGGGNYELTAHANNNVLMPGYWMLFALDAAGVPSEAHVLRVLRSGAPAVTDPGDQTTFVGNDVSLQIEAIDLTGDPLTYSAGGLPPGLTIDPDTGLISGTADTAGVYAVSITVSDGTSQTVVDFDWRVLNAGQGVVLREWWTGISGNSIAALLGDPRYPDNPDGVETVAAFEAPTDWADNYGTRMRGLLYPPETGNYTFWIASDDNGQLWLSSDEAPAGAIMIANVPGWSAPRDWEKFPQQQSVTIPLQAGQRYYIEALQKEGGGGDNLAVAWQVPGGSREVIDGAFLSPPGTGSVVEVIAIDAGFDAGTDGFGYIDDAFRGTAQPAYASGTYEPTGGHAGGGLRVAAGGVDDADITGMSGGWLRTFTLEAPAVVSLSLRYNLTIGAGYESDEFGEALVSLDGSLIGDGPNAALAQLAGDGNGGEDTTTGWQAWTIQIPLDPGDHTLIAGGYNNKKTIADELTTVRFDDVRVSWFVSAPNAPPVLTPPATQAGIVGNAVSLLLSASDPDGDALGFSASGLPEGLSIDSSTGAISGTLTLAGNYAVIASVDDGNGGEDSAGFAWSVGEPLNLGTLTSMPKVVGADVPYTAPASGGLNPQYKWLFGDGTPETSYSASASMTHAFALPGRYLVTLTATDDTANELSTSFWQSIHEPLTAGQPASSSTLAYESRSGGDRVWAVNPDTATVTVIDAETAVMLGEIAVEQKPRAVAVAPDGRIWVVNKDSDSISVIDPDTLSVADVVVLPRASQPHGLVFDGAGLNTYLVLEATGQLVALNPLTGAQTAITDVGPNPRHIAIDAADQFVYVSRFVSPPLPGEDTAVPMTETGAVKHGGEVVVVSTSGLTVSGTIVLEHSAAVDSENSARGIPNYLGAVAISPDGLSAWVPSKQDNIKRGMLRDGQPLTHDSTVRAIASYLDLGAGGEDIAGRVDHDDASVVSAATHGAWGNWLFSALEGNREVAAVDAYARDEVYRFNVGRAPQGLVVSPDGLTLYVHNFMDRTVSVHDLSKLVIDGELDVTPVATVTTVSSETLAPDVLLGKQLFYDARDPRLAREKYMACAACHNDAGGDGRVWDFTGFGEGLRNTVSLDGHGDHGMLHWTANFDEVQDFEGQIRIFGGTGLMDDADFNAGTRSAPLGDPKAGISADLDALAAYVQSLTGLAGSPHRDPTGALTADGIAGRAIFDSNGCAACHGGPAFSDSPDGVGVHDVGTIKPASGSFLGGPLTGFDTPSLRGVWATAPWLHDGSAATVTAAIAAHSGVTVSGPELDQLAAFVLQIDEAEPAVPLNHAPLFAAPGARSDAEGDTVLFSVAAVDPDGDVLAYFAAGLPPGAAFDPDSAEISGQLTAMGDYSVTITADDGRGGNDETSFSWTVTAPVDTDADAIADYLDNCTLVANADQRDTNGDGFGNLCDADLDNDGTVNFGDLALMKAAFLTADADADLDGNGVVNFGDLARLKAAFLQPPGPAGNL